MNDMLSSYVTACVAGRDAPLTAADRAAHRRYRRYFATLRRRLA